MIVRFQENTSSIQTVPQPTDKFKGVTNMYGFRVWMILWGHGRWIFRQRAEEKSQVRNSLNDSQWVTSFFHRVHSVSRTHRGMLSVQDKISMGCWIRRCTATVGFLEEFFNVQFSLTERELRQLILKSYKTLFIFENVCEWIRCLLDNEWVKIRSSHKQLLWSQLFSTLSVVV